MAQYNTIRKIIQQLIYKSKRLILNNVSSFLSLILIHILIMLAIVIITQWIYDNIELFNLELGVIIFRLSFSLLISGIWIGFFKLIFNFIDNKKINFTNIFKYFYLLPKFIAIRLLSYLSILPVLAFVLYKFPYNFTIYGTNIGQYLIDILENLIEAINDDISWQLYSAYFNSSDILIIGLLLLFPIWYILRFWCAELFLIDQETDIYNSLLKSFVISNNKIHFIIISSILVLINLFSLLLGYIVFIVSLTFSYLLFFIYYRLLLKSRLNVPKRKAAL